MLSGPRQSLDIYLKHIDDHKYIRDYAKGPLKEVIVSHFKTLGQIVGNYELTIRRTKQSLEESDGNDQ